MPAFLPSSSRIYTISRIWSTKSGPNSTKFNQDFLKRESRDSLLIIIIIICAAVLEAIAIAKIIMVVQQVPLERQVLQGRMENQDEMVLQVPMACLVTIHQLS